MFIVKFSERLLRSSLVASLQRKMLRKASFGLVKNIRSCRMLMPSFKQISFQQTCANTGSAEPFKYLQREKRKEFYVTSEELKTAIENDDVYVVDVREPSEVKEGRIAAKRYINMPIGVSFVALMLSEEEFENQYKKPKPQINDKIVFVCSHGVRSTFCLQVGQELGYEKCKHYLGGMTEWESKYPVLKE